MNPEPKFKVGDKVKTNHIDRDLKYYNEFVFVISRVIFSVSFKRFFYYLSGLAMPFFDTELKLIDSDINCRKNKL
jgi:hypothetical protein